MNLLLLEVDLQRLGIEAYFIKVDWRVVADGCLYYFN